MVGICLSASALALGRLLDLLLGLAARVRLRARHLGTILDATPALQLITDSLEAREEALRERRRGRDLVGVQRAHERWRDEHHQLGTLRTNRLALEQVPDDRQLCEARHFLQIIL